jgi:hypothetical protein
VSIEILSVVLLLLNATARCSQMFNASERGFARSDFAGDNPPVEPSYLDDTLNEAECNTTRYRRPLKFWRPMTRLDSEQRSRWLLFGAPTRALYEQWRRAQRW